MKALVLAGGFGTRLRPLTCTRPKLLLPVANKPLIDWALENLARAGVDTAILLVNYLADSLKRELGDARHGVKLHYSQEEYPLSTGGAIRNASHFLEGDEEFLAMNGDILSDFDLRDMIRFHREKQALVTIALHEVSDVSRFGVVEMDREGRIGRFVEKPKPKEAPSNLINAGIYVMQSQALELIPPGRVSIERQVFPRIARLNKLYGYQFEGFWADIGKPEDYLTANAAMLRNLSTLPVTSESCEIAEGVELTPPVALGSSICIEAGSKIGPFASIADGVHIGRDAVVQNAIILPHAEVGNATRIRDSIIGEGVRLGSSVIIEGLVLIGDNAHVADGVRITDDVRICPWREVTESVSGPARIL